jgi:hypothetical protein
VQSDTVFQVIEGDVKNERRDMMVVRIECSGRNPNGESVMLSYTML